MKNDLKVTLIMILTVQHLNTQNVITGEGYKLQLVQNFATRIVANKRKYDHVTPMLKSLNW